MRPLSARYVATRISAVVRSQNSEPLKGPGICQTKTRGRGYELFPPSRNSRSIYEWRLDELAESGCFGRVRINRKRVALGEQATECMLVLWTFSNVLAHDARTLNENGQLMLF